MLWPNWELGCWLYYLCPWYWCDAARYCPTVVAQIHRNVLFIINICNQSQGRNHKSSEIRTHTVTAQMNGHWQIEMRDWLWLKLDWPTRITLTLEYDKDWTNQILHDKPVGLTCTTLHIIRGKGSSQYITYHIQGKGRHTGCIPAMSEGSLRLMISSSHNHTKGIFVITISGSITNPTA